MLTKIIAPLIFLIVLVGIYTAITVIRDKFMKEDSPGGCVGDCRSCASICDESDQAVLKEEIEKSIRGR